MRKGASLAWRAALKKISVVLVLALAIACGAYLFNRFFSPQNNGEAEVERIVAKSNTTNNPCKYSGFVFHKNINLLQVFLACNISATLKNIPVGTQDELTQAIHSKVVEPLLDSFPDKKDVLVTFIAAVQRDAVICTDIKDKKIIRSSYDSYENYCWPK